MAESSLDSLCETHAMDVEWRAFELRPVGMPPIPPEAEAAHREKIAAGWPRVQQIARERFGLEMRRMEGDGHHPTRLAHVGAKFASERGQGEAYQRAVFRAALQDETYLAAVETDEYWAWQQGLNGVPAFIFGRRYLVSGAQPPEVLRQVADQCIEEGRVT